MMKYYFASNKKRVLSTSTIKKVFSSQTYNAKSKEDIVARVHKYNINTITMVIFIFKILGFP